MLRVGRVVAAFGVGGAVKVQSLTDFDDRFAPGSELVVAGTGHRVEWSRAHPPGRVVKLAGLEDRAAAEGLRGRYLEVPDEAAHPLPEHTWYRHELVGLRVVTAGGRDLGNLTEVLARPANDVWVAESAAGVEHLVPATKQAVIEVDLEAGRVTVADWLLQVEDA